MGEQNRHEAVFIRRDRLAEIESYFGALDEWGAEGEYRQVAILEFLQSPIGLTEYLERDLAAVSGRA